MFRQIFLAAIALVICLPMVTEGTAAAVTAADWKAGRIIDDVVFTNKDDMSVQQIQTFLNSKVGTSANGRIAGQCDTNGQRTSELGGGTRAEYGAARGNPAPFTCLKDYYEVPKTQPGAGIPASNYGGAAIPAGARSAAQLIWDASQRYSINPKVLLVTIQKESAGPLTTDDWPLRSQYTYAMGAHCPDSGPGGSANCDPNYAGFSIQISESAALLRYYLDNMQKPWWPYKKPFQINSIKLNVPDSCGASNVYIETMATAALYTYTPYQPNQAALNNLYGTGDGCSAYGNRNFWRIYSDWFGSTNGDLVRANGGVYKLESGTKRPFPNEITFLSYGYVMSRVVPISDSQLAQIPDGAAMQYNTNFRNGFLVRQPSGGMYVIENGLRRPFPNEETFFSYGFKFTDALVISSTELNLIPDGTSMPYKTSHRNGRIITSASHGIYRIENGTKRPFPNDITFISNGYKYSDVLAVSNKEHGLIPDGAAMQYNTNFRNGFLVRQPSGGMYVIENGLRRPFPNEETFFSYGFKFTDALVISSTELNLIPDGTSMPLKS